jgi:hypothetical protein
MQGTKNEGFPCFFRTQRVLEMRRLSVYVHGDGYG